MALPNRHFKICFNSEEVFWEALYSQQYGAQEYEEITGLFNFVVRGMRFSYDYVVDGRDVDIIDESAVEQLPNGAWTGIVGLLNRSEIDYAPAALILTEEQYDAMAYNYPYASDELTFATRKPEYSPDMTALFRTLSLNVWSSLLACILLVTLACFVAMKHRCTLGDILLHVLAIGLNQEGNLVPRRAGEALLLSTWLGAMAVFTFCFKSVLLSFLTFPPLGGVRTVPELAAAIRAGQYIAYTYPDNDFARYLQRSPNEDFRVIGESMLKNPNYGGRFGGLLVDGPQYANVAFVNARSIVSASGMLYVSEDNMGTFHFATAVSRNFCCKEEMDMLVHRFQAAGINGRIRRITDHKNTVIAYAVIPAYLMKQPEGEQIRQLTMTDLAGAFILLVAGHCLSVCVLIIECCLKSKVWRRFSTRTP